MIRPLLFSLLTLPAFSQVSVHWSFNTDGCPIWQGNLLGPCEPSGLALCLYPTNPGSLIAGSQVYADTLYACSEGGIRYEGSGDPQGVLFGVQSFGSVMITDVHVEWTGDSIHLYSPQGTPPFHLDGVAYFQLTNSGTSWIHSITVTAEVPTGIRELERRENLDGLPAYDVRGRNMVMRPSSNFQRLSNSLLYIGP